MVVHGEGDLWGQPFILRPDQELWAWQWYEVDPLGSWWYERCYMEAPKGDGKALALTTPVLTVDGWRTMGDLQVGDTVFDELGQPCKVTFATDVQHGHDCFAVKFSDGAEIIADADHRWWTEELRRDYRGSIKTTREISTSVSPRSDGARNHRIPVAAPLALPERSLPLDPYTLGVWLGDGTSLDGAITLATFDADPILARVESAGYKCVLRPSTLIEGRQCATWGVRGLRVELRAIGVLGAKRIPPEYFVAGSAQRWALLQGLMDTDGHASLTSAQCELTSVDEGLALDALALMATLGIKATIGEYRAVLDGRDCGPKWRVSFSARSDQPIFHIERKQSRVKPAPVNRSSMTLYRHIVEVAPVPSVPVRCIQVDSPSHLYLAGERLIPTHNTMIMAADALFNLAGPLAPPAPNIPVAAASQDQCRDDGLFKRIKDIVSQDACPLKPFLDVGYDLIKFKDGRPGQIRCIPANGNTTDGGLPTEFIADEVQDWFHTAADAHERNENSTTKREQPVGRSLSGSTPGEYAGDGSVGWRLHNYGEQIKKGTVNDERFLFSQHTASDKWKIDDPTAKDFAEQLDGYLREANPGISPRKLDRLKRRYHEIPLHRFHRFHGGRWAISDGVRWMDMEAFGLRTRQGYRPPIGTSIVAMFDGSINDDSTGIMAMTLGSETEKPHQFVMGCWEKPEWGPKWSVPRHEVKARVAEMFRDYRVRLFYCDPSAWLSEFQEWEAEYGAETVLEIPPTDARLAPMCEQYLADIIDDKITHDGDPRLFDHIRNAIGKPVAKRGDSIRKESPNSPRKIDLAVCAAGANDARLRVPPDVAPAGASMPAKPSEVFRPGRLNL